MSATESEYKGKPTLELKDQPDDRYGLTFGLTKARLILEHIEEIREFVDKHSEERGA